MDVRQWWCKFRALLHHFCWNCEHYVMHDKAIYLWVQEFWKSHGVKVKFLLTIKIQIPSEFWQIGIKNIFGPIVTSHTCNSIPNVTFTCALKFSLGISTIIPTTCKIQIMLYQTHNFVLLLSPLSCSFFLHGCKVFVPKCSVTVPMYTVYILYIPLTTLWSYFQKYRNFCPPHSSILLKVLVLSIS